MCDIAWPTRRSDPLLPGEVCEAVQTVADRERLPLNKAVSPGQNGIERWQLTTAYVLSNRPEYQETGAKVRPHGGGKLATGTAAMIDTRPGLTRALPDV